jgi:cyanobactin maturation PatA/PatG family protease
MPIDQEPDPDDPEQLLAYLEDNPWDAAAIFWTLLNPEGKPIYTIQPKGPFASQIYDRLRRFLDLQVKKEIERISVPGCLGASVALSTGQTVRNVAPELRGMSAWSTDQLVDAAFDVIGSPKRKTKNQSGNLAKEKLKEFLEYIYRERCNLGAAAEERALNYTATNIRQVAEIFNTASVLGLEFDEISITRSQSCFLDSNRLDVRLVFFDPKRNFKVPNNSLFAVDVGDDVPVLVGDVRVPFVPSPGETPPSEEPQKPEG